MQLSTSTRPYVAISHRFQVSDLAKPFTVFHLCDLLLYSYKLEFCFYESRKVREKMFSANFGQAAPNRQKRGYYRPLIGSCIWPIE